MRLSLSHVDRDVLLDAGFVVVPGPVPADRLASLADSYDAVVRDAAASDVHVGSTTTRVSDLVNRGSAFDEVYLHAPLLEACEAVIDGPFKLSSLQVRTLRPHMPPQGLHVDFARDAAGWPMVGFILMIDDFRVDNGATRFVPGSHHRPVGVDVDAAADEGIPVCGAAGAMILYNGSIVHGHGANHSGTPRRSIQGAYIRRDAASGTDFSMRMRPDTLARLTPLAKQLLAL